MDDGVRTRDTWSHSPVLYQLSYTHHQTNCPLGRPRNPLPACELGPADACRVWMARLEGIEPPTDGLEIRCSILLSYRRRVHVDSSRDQRPDTHKSRGERI